MKIRNESFNKNENKENSQKEDNNDDEQEKLYRTFLNNAQKEKQKFKSMKKGGLDPYKTMYATKNRNHDSNRKTTIDCSGKNASKHNNLKGNKTANKNLIIAIDNPNMNKNNSHKTYKTLNNGNIDVDTGLEDNNDENDKKGGNRKMAFSSGKNDKKQRKNEWQNDPLNPYLTNWASSFLKIGYNVGFHFNEYQEGVPLLRLQKLRKKIFLPPIYTVKYNKYTDNKNGNNDDDDAANLVCSKVSKKLFSPIATHYIPRNKSKISIYPNLNYGLKDKEKNENEKRILTSRQQHQTISEIDGENIEIVREKNENNNNTLLIKEPDNVKEKEIINEKESIKEIENNKENENNREQENNKENENNREQENNNENENNKEQENNKENENNKEQDYIKENENNKEQENNNKENEG